MTRKAGKDKKVQGRQRVLFLFDGWVANGCDDRRNGFQKLVFYLSEFGEKEYYVSIDEEGTSIMKGCEKPQWTGR